MAYERTIAFPSRSTAFHGGDPGWIRHANGPSMTRPSFHKPDLAGLGFGVEEASTAATIATTIAELGKTFAEMRQQKMEGKAAKNAANAQQEKADREAAAAIADAAAATQKAAQIRAQPSVVDEISGNKTMLVGGVIGLAALIGLVVYLRR